MRRMFVPNFSLGIRHSGRLMIERGLKDQEGSSAVKTGPLELLKEMKIDRSSETSPLTLNVTNTAQQSTTSHITIKKEILRTLVRAKRENLRWIHRKSGAVLKITSEGESVSISGGKFEVEDAEKILRRIIKNISVKEMQVDAKKMASLIGVKGQNRERIEKQTGAVLTGSEKGEFFPGTQNRVVTISGVEEAVKEAEQMIEDQMENTVAREVQVDAKKMAFLIGVRGKNRERIEQETGAVVNTSEKGVFVPGTWNRVVTISGVEEAVKEAEQMIEDQMENTVVKEVQVDAKKMASLIGVKGQNKERIEQESGVVVNTSEKGEFFPGTRNQVVTISGTREAVKEAEKMIEEQIDDTVVKEVQVDAKKMASLIGVKGQNRERVEQQTGALVMTGERGEFDPGTQKQVITISGTEEAVCEAEKILMAQIMSTVVDDMTVAARATHSLIGAKGENMSRIQSLTGAALDLRQEERLSVVTISGTREAVKEARKLIANQVG